MKSIIILNLVMAIVYTVIFALILLCAMAKSEGETMAGAVLLSGSVVANWITWNYLRNNTK